MQASLYTHREADDLFRTWVHESLHARQQFARGHAQEYSVTRGYEEGMVEGLSRLIVVNRAAMPYRPPSSNYYVTAYDTLAYEAGIPVEELWRQLWEHAAGAVRLHFVDTVAQLIFKHSGRMLTGRQLSQLRVCADRAFGSSRAGDVPHERLLRWLWRTGLT